MISTYAHNTCVIAMVAACGAPSDGALHGACYPNGTCNVTLTCVRGTCVGFPADAAVHGSPFQCADDSSVEGPNRNDTIGTAFLTPVALQRKNVSFAGLAICPPTDKDFYRVDLTGTQNIEAIVTYDDPTKPGAGPLNMEIDNSGGIALVQATLVTGMPNTIRAYASNLPMPSGPYYIHVEGDGVTENNYKLDINVTP
jgi:hypothetical protein